MATFCHAARFLLNAKLSDSLPYYLPYLPCEPVRLRTRVAWSVGCCCCTHLRAGLDGNGSQLCNLLGTERVRGACFTRLLIDEGSTKRDVVITLLVPFSDANDSLDDAFAESLHDVGVWHCFIMPRLVTTHHAAHRDYAFALRRAILPSILFFPCSLFHLKKEYVACQKRMARISRK